ncbi:unnamed protein product, partial [Didymodactylos carnosus]
RKSTEDVIEDDIFDHSDNGNESEDSGSGNENQQPPFAFLSTRTIVRPTKRKKLSASAGKQVKRARFEPQQQ